MWCSLIAIMYYTQGSSPDNSSSYFKDEVSCRTNPNLVSIKFTRSFAGSSELVVTVVLSTEWATSAADRFIS